MPSITITVDYAVDTGPFFGACPANPGGESMTAAATVTSKWGEGAAVRQFFGGLPAMNVPAGASIVHASGKPSDSSVNSGSLDAQIEALIAATPDGCIIELHHESDNDGLTASGIAARIAAKNRLYDIKQVIKPGVLVAHTMTGGFWASYGNDSTRDTWVETARGDLLGLDADGVHDTAGPTYDTSYADEVNNIKRYLARFAFKWQGWTVPEFGTSRQPWDTTGQPRADWIQAQVEHFADAYAVMAYDYNTSAHNTATDYNQFKVGTPEYDVWRALI